jgi:hypothetical protein
VLEGVGREMPFPPSIHRADRRERVRRRHVESSVNLPAREAFFNDLSLMPLVRPGKQHLARQWRGHGTDDAGGSRPS